MVSAAYVSSGTLIALHVQPRIGQLFGADQDIQGGDVHKAILSDSLWRRSFASDAAVLGKTLRIDDKNLQIVGVMPPGFGFPVRTEIWIPVESRWVNATVPSQRPIVKSYSVLGRLQPAVSLEQTRDEIRSLAAATNRDSSQTQLSIRTLRQAETGQLRPYLVALIGGVGCLALICIANVSTLQLARGASKQREFALRAALGASVTRNLRIQLAESLLVAVGGAILGTAIGIAGLRAIASQIPVELPSWMRLEVDFAALAFCIGLAGISSLVSGVLPAWRAVRQDPNSVLKSGGRGPTDRAVLRSGLVVGEIGFSTMLLVCALLMMQTLDAMQKRDPGFRSDGLLTIRAVRSQPGNRIDRGRVLSQVHEGVLARLSALPGVVSGSLSNRLPFTSGGDSRTIADLTITGSESDNFRKAAFFGSADVSPDYFRTMGIPLLRGRAFTQADTAESPPVVIINDRAAKALWPNRDPLGQQVTWGKPRPENPPATVVGVVGNIRNFAAEADRGLEFYYSYVQYTPDAVFYVLRTSVDPASLIQAARQTIQATDPSIAVSTIKTMPQWIDDSMWQTRIWSWLFGAFAAIAVVLAAIGIYGLVSYLVLLRSKEMVIRLSLGATGSHIASLVFGGMLRLVLLGAAAGVAGSFAVSRLIEGLLFQVSPTDTRTYALVLGVITGIAMLACCPPVLRSVRINPTSVLKED
jgi:predicted permease